MKIVTQLSIFNDTELGDLEKLVLVEKQGVAEMTLPNKLLIFVARQGILTWHSFPNKGILYALCHREAVAVRP